MIEGRIAEPSLSLEDPPDRLADFIDEFRILGDEDPNTFWFDQPLDGEHDHRHRHSEKKCGVQGAAMSQKRTRLHSRIVGLKQIPAATHNVLAEMIGDQTTNYIVFL